MRKTLAVACVLIALCAAALPAAAYQAQTASTRNTSPPLNIWSLFEFGGCSASQTQGVIDPVDGQMQPEHCETLLDLSPLATVSWTNSCSNNAVEKVQLSGKLVIDGFQQFHGGIFPRWQLVVRRITSLDATARIGNRVYRLTIDATFRSPSFARLRGYGQIELQNHSLDVLQNEQFDLGWHSSWQFPRLASTTIRCPS